MPTKKKILDKFFTILAKLWVDNTYRTFPLLEPKYAISYWLWSHLLYRSEFWLLTLEEYQKEPFDFFDRRNRQCNISDRKKSDGLGIIQEFFKNSEWKSSCLCLFLFSKRFRIVNLGRPDEDCKILESGCMHWDIESLPEGATIGSDYFWFLVFLLQVLKSK